MRSSYLFLIVLIFYTSSKASFFGDVSNLEYQDLVIYDKVSALCGEQNTRQYSEKMKIWFSSFMSSSVVHSVIQSKNPVKISTSFQTMVNSPGFFLALEKCYGQNSDHKKIFVSSLLVLEMSGKLGSWVADARLFSALYHGISAGVAGLSAQIKMPLSWFKIVTQLHLKQPIFMNVSLPKILLGVAGAQALTEGYLMYDQLFNQMNILQRIKLEEAIQKSKQKIIQLESRKRFTNDPEKLEAYDFFIYQENERIKVYQLKMKK